MSRIHQLYVSTFLLTLIPAAAYGGYGVLPGSGNNISNYSVSKISETSSRAGADRNGSFSAAADWNIILSDGVSRDGVRKIFLNAENEGAAYSLPENSGNSKIIPSLKTQGGVGEGFKPTLTSGSISVAERATLSRCGHSVCNAHFASLPLAYELTNSHLSLKISPLEIFSASSPEFSGREKKRGRALRL